MNHRRLDAFLRRQHGGERLHFDLDQLGRVLGAVRIIGKDRGDGVADVAHDVLRERPLPVRLEALDARLAEFDRWNIRHVGERPDRGAARSGAGLFGVDGDEAPMGVRGADHPHVKLAGERSLHGETALGAHERQILQARQRPADVGLLHRRLAAAARTAATMFW